VTFCDRFCTKCLHSALAPEDFLELWSCVSIARIWKPAGRVLLLMGGGYIAATSAEQQDEVVDLSFLRVTGTSRH